MPHNALSIPDSTSANSLIVNVNSFHFSKTWTYSSRVLQVGAPTCPAEIHLWPPGPRYMYELSPWVPSADVFISSARMFMFQSLTVCPPPYRIPKATEAKSPLVAASTLKCLHFSLNLSMACSTPSTTFPKSFGGAILTA